MAVKKHTPGPWTAGGGTGMLNQMRIEPCIGVIFGAGEEIKANAALITSAPDLLDVALRVQEAWGYISEYDVPIGLKERLDAAINKALEGEEQ